MAKWCITLYSHKHVLHNDHGGKINGFCNISNLYSLHFCWDRYRYFDRFGTLGGLVNDIFYNNIDFNVSSLRTTFLNCWNSKPNKTR